MTTRGHLIDSTGTARRLQALAAIGWASADLGERLGRCPERSRTLINRWRNPHQRVHTTTAAQVAALYTQLEGTPGPSVAARTHAREAGWAPPLAWHDLDIDDPRTRPRTTGPRDPHPDEVLVERVIAGRAPLWHLPVRHRPAAVGPLRHRGWTWERIAEHVQASEPAVMRHASRWHTPDDTEADPASQHREVAS